jgi:hypothetical protein
MTDPQAHATEANDRLTDPIEVQMLGTLAARLRKRDPALLGVYAEHLVAHIIGGSVSEGAWEHHDVAWDRPNNDGSVSHIEIQVKVAGMHGVFKDGIVNSVSFATRPTKTLKAIWEKEETSATWAAVWVFALHTSTEVNEGWRFFVCPGAYLSLIGNGSIALNTLILRLGPPVGSDELASAVSKAWDRPEEFTEPSSWACPQCEGTFPKLRNLIAHQAAAGHAWSVASQFPNLDG